jgi:hypothetical protein
MFTNFMLFMNWVQILQVRTRFVVNLLEYEVCCSRFINLVFNSFIYLEI